MNHHDLGCENCCPNETEGQLAERMVEEENNGTHCPCSCNCNNK